MRVHWLILGSLMTLALLSLTLRIALPQLDFYKGHIATALTEITGQVIHDEQIQVSLSAYSPNVSVSDIEIGQALEKNYIHIGKLDVEIALWQSLWQRRPVIRFMRLFDGQVGIVRTPTDKFQLHPKVMDLLGEEDEKASSTDQSIEIALMNIKVNAYDQKSKNLNTFHVEQFVFETKNKNHQLGGRIVLPETLGKSLEGSVAIQGDLLDIDTWSSQFHLNGVQLNIARWLQQMNLSQDYVGIVNGSVWGEFSAERVGWVTSQLYCKSCQVEGYDFDIKTRLYVKNTPEQWHVEVANADFAIPNQVKLKDVSIGVRKKRTDSFADTVLEIKNFSGELLEQIRQIPMIGDTIETLGLHVKSGTLHIGVRIPVTIPHEFPNKALGSELAKKFESFKLLKVIGELNDGYITAGSTPQAAKQTFDNVSIQLRSVRKQDAFVFIVDQLDFVSDDMKIDAQSLWHERKNMSPKLMLGAEVADIRVQEVLRWIPNSFMNETLHKLRQTLLSGEIEKAKVAWLGDTSNFSFASIAQALQLDATVRNLSVRYDPEQKPVRDVDMDIRLNQNKLSASIPKARYKGYSVEDISINIDDLSKPYLAIQGRGKGPAEELIQVLQATSVLDQKILAGIDIGGNTVLNLTLGVALDEAVSQALTLNGELIIDDGLVYLSEQDIRLDEVRAHLTFEDTAIHAPTIQARLNRKYPITANIATEQKKISLHVTTQAIPIAFFSKRFLPEQAWVKGATAWQMQLDIPGIDADAGDNMHLRLSSKLEGVSIALPAPLGKSVAENKPLVLDIDWHAQEERYQFRYAGSVDGQASSQKGLLTRAQVHFGQGQRSAHNTAFALTGSIQETVAIEQWQALLNQGKKSKQSNNALLPLSVDIRFADLVYGKNDLNAVALTANIRSASNWQASIDSDLLKGKLQSEKGQDRIFIKAQMDSMILPDDKSFKFSEGDSNKLRPSDFPVFEVTAKRVRYGDFSCENFKLISDYTKNSWVLTDLHCDTGEIQLKMKGKWLERGRSETTEAQFKVTGNNYGQWLESWKLNNSIRGGTGVISGNIKWPGGINDFSLEKALGAVSVDLDNIRIAEASVGGGLMRLFGLLNLGRIARQLSTDFGGVLRGGLAGDKLKGKFTLKKENLYTDLSLDSAALSLSMAGRVGVRARDYDQTMEVIPRLGSTGSLVAGSVLGGPIGGAAVFLVNKLTNLGKKIDRIYALNYSITGSWDNPIIQLVDAKETDEVNTDKSQGNPKRSKKEDKPMLNSTLDWFDKQLKKGKEIILPEKK